MWHFYRSVVMMKSLFKKLTGSRSPPDPLSSLQPESSPQSKAKLAANQVRATMVSSVSHVISHKRHRMLKPPGYELVK